MTAHTRIKICGICSVEHALVAAEAGADAIGLVFYEPSPRYVTPSAARAIVAALPPFVSSVGLFVNPTDDYVRSVLDEVPLDLLQFHGDEAPEFCASFGRRWIKAIRVRSNADIESAFENYRDSTGLLVDAFDPERYGGTGLSFDWSLIPDQRALALVLAGGLNSANVATAVASVRPWGVDVSGGVEISKGRKDASLIQEFIREVRRVDKTD